MKHVRLSDDFSASPVLRRGQNALPMDHATGVEPLSAREVYRVVMVHVAQECPELKREWQ